MENKTRIKHYRFPFVIYGKLFSGVLRIFLNDNTDDDDDDDSLAFRKTAENNNDNNKHLLRSTDTYIQQEYSCDTLIYALKLTPILSLSLSLFGNTNDLFY